MSYILFNLGPDERLEWCVGLARFCSAVDNA